MKNAPFSVAISVYKNDDPHYFDKALESITDNQTIKPNEIVLVVDGPVPSETNAIIDKYASNYPFKVIRLEQNQGLGNALKVATENCTNDLIARMDSDDIAAPGRFEQQLTLFESFDNLDICGGDISEFIDDETNIVGYRRVPKQDDEIKKFMKKRCPFNHMTVMMKKKALFSSGGYIDFYYNEDYYLWIRMFQNGFIFGNTGTVLVNVRTGKDQYARRGGIKYFRSELKIQKYMRQRRIIGAFLYFVNCMKRFVVQCMLPKCIRGIVYRLIIRKKNLKNAN